MLDGMIVGRLFGWLFLLAGLGVLARDLMNAAASRVWDPIALGQLWYNINRSSLNLLQAVVQRYLSPLLWDTVIQTILLCWAFAVLIVVGVSLLIVFRRRQLPSA